MASTRRAPRGSGRGAPGLSLPAGVAESFGRHEAEPPGGAEHKDAAFILLLS